MPAITLRCDDLDAAAIHTAVAVHQSRQRVGGQHMLPDHGSSTLGATIAEICRDWCERHGAWPTAEE